MSFTEGELEGLFSLSSSAPSAGCRPTRDPNPLNSGTASLSGVAGLSESVRFKYDGVITAGAGRLWLAGNAAKLGFGDTVGLAIGADLLEGLRAGS